MPPPLDALAVIARLPDEALPGLVEIGDGRKASLQFALYDLLRHEQALAVEVHQLRRSEIDRILDLAQAAYGELVGLLVGRPDEILETARDGEWSLRDLLRHAIAVEIRYTAQVEYSATRAEGDPLAIPADRLPCDRLSPPDAGFGDSRSAGITRVLELLGDARARSDRQLSSIPSAALERPSLWGAHQMTLRMRLNQMAAHLTEVQVQAEKCLGPELRSETRRILGHCCRARGSHERASAAEARSALDRTYLLAGQAR